MIWLGFDSIWLGFKLIIVRIALIALQDFLEGPRTSYDFLDGPRKSKEVSRKSLGLPRKLREPLEV